MRPTNRLRELRKANGWTQQRLADATGVSQPAISQIENGTLSLDLAWMRAFARVLKCAPSDLLTDEDNPDRLEHPERELVEHFRQADDQQRELVQRVASPTAGYRAEPRHRAA